MQHFFNIRWLELNLTATACVDIAFQTNQKIIRD